MPLCSHHTAISAITLNVYVQWHTTAAAAAQHRNVFLFLMFIIIMIIIVMIVRNSPLSRLRTRIATTTADNNCTHGTRTNRKKYVWYASRRLSPVSILLPECQ